MIKCIAADDELPALDLLEDNIINIPYLQLIKKCRNAFEIIEVINQEEIDLIFLDIQMPGLTGLQFVKALSDKKPMIIFVTAYEKFAVESYNLQALDYLVKPVPFDRFLLACNRAKEQFDLRLNSGNSDTMEEDDYIFINSEYSLIKVKYQDIYYVKGLKDYVMIYMKDREKPIITAMNLKSIEEKLPSKFFKRIHKSYIVNFTCIESVRSGFIIIENQEALPIGDMYKEKLMNLILKK
jgi:two-component system, LytTR family, response regulator